MSNLDDRFFVLTKALEKSAQTGYFTIYERMLIHQERAAIFRAKDSISADQDNPEQDYIVPDALEAKIQNLITNP